MHMNGGAIFVVFLAAGFFSLVTYLAISSLRAASRQHGDEIENRGANRDR